MDNFFICICLKNKTYVHSRYYAFNISDPKPRIIPQATVRDRTLHHLIYQNFTEYFDSKFIHDSYSCPTGKRNSQSDKQISGDDFQKGFQKQTQKPVCIKCDIRKFFASIDHKIFKRNFRKIYSG